MAPSAKVKAAFKAMKAIGISETKTKPALKKLLQVYEKNWVLIEEENYRVLADAIFEYEETETAEEKKKKTSENAERGEALEPITREGGSMPYENVQDELERPLKRLRLKHQRQGGPSNGQPSPTSGVVALLLPKPEPGEADTSPNQRGQPMTRSRQSRNIRAEPQPVSPQPLVRNKGKQPVSERPSEALQIKGPKGTAPSGKQKQPQINALIVPKDEPFTDDMDSIEPLAVVLPECLNKKAHSKPTNEVDSHDGQTSATVDILDKGMDIIASTEQEKQLVEVDVSHRAPAILDIAASTLGAVKLSLTCSLGSEGDALRGPDFEAVLKKATDCCLRACRINDPQFSVTDVMKQFCDCVVVELGKMADGAPEGSVGQDADIIDNNGISNIPSVSSSLNGDFSEIVAVTTDRTLADNSTPPLASISPEIHMQSIVNYTEDNCAERDNTFVDINLQSIVVAQPYDTSDITGGDETVMVSLEKSNCEFLPSFHYISRNVIADNADVKFSLAQIGDKDCCLSCHGDCLPLSSSCHCSQRNGGVSPYTPDSLVGEEFLDECVSMVRNPQEHNLMYCKECPLERMKNEDMLDPCKGHLKRKFIKECYTKCGCSQYCGNRVVQRGIRCNLQVFWTPEGKGWGLRTLDSLPKGAFVCEFVGEILTVMELCKRNQTRSDDKHSFSLLLDTDWGTNSLKEEELLCLDATFYGNVARFINHRCTDANLIEIPVEVETPNHHYYHAAFFTTRTVNAFEELTWDYGVDFDEGDQHNKAFRCLCSSQFCRNMKRSSRSRSTLTLQ